MLRNKNGKTILLAALTLAFAGASLLDSPATAQIKSFQKVNSVVGGFTGTLGPGSLFGSGAAHIGDLDDDGIPDIVVSEPGNEAIWILFLNSNGTVKGHQRLGSPVPGTNYGSDMAGIGDLDNDGIEDIVVGARRDDDGGTNRGAVWIFFMNTSGTVKALQKISDIVGGFTGVLDNNDEFGSSVAGIGDIDGDSIPDIAVGAPRDDDGFGNEGAVWILFLTANGLVKSHAKISATQGGFTNELNGTNFFGVAITSIGDLDGDNHTDIAVGHDSPSKVWILFLNSGGTIDSYNEIDIVGASFGNSVSWLGDIDGDGFGELAVGASTDDGPFFDSIGRVWYLSLDSAGAITRTAEVSLELGLDVSDYLGSSVAGVGDLNGDGIPDAVSGARGDDDSAGLSGAVYVLFSGECRVEPGNIDFGTIKTGESADRDFTLHNDTDSTLTGSVTESCAEFEVVSGGGAYSLLSGDSLAVTVRFTPAAYDVIYRCVVDAGCALVGLAGEGGEPEIVVTPTSVTQQVEIGSSVQDSVKIENRLPNSTLPLAVLNWQINTGALPPWISVAPESGSLTKFTSEHAVFTLDAVTLPAGTHVDTVFIDSNDTDEPTVPVEVTLEVLRQDVALSDSSLVFSDVFVGGSSLVGAWIYNIGTFPLVGNASIADGTHFALVGSGVFNLSAGDSVFQNISFQPALAGVHADTLVVNSDDPNDPVVFATLDGIAIDPTDITAEPDSIWGVVPIGGSVARTITVSNAGALDANVQFRLVSVSPNSVSPPPMRNPDPPAEPWESAGSPLASRRVLGPQSVTPTLLPFIEDFEDGDFNGWVLGPGSATRAVTSLSAANGTAFSYRETNATSGHSNGIYWDFGSTTPADVSFWVRSGSVSTFDTYVTLRDSTLQEAIFFFAQGNGNFYCNANVGGHSTFPYLADVWYHVEYRDVDFTAKNFDYYIDGNLVQADISFRNPGTITHFGRLDLYNFTAGSEGWWDEIVFSPIPPPAWLSITPPSGTVLASGDLIFDVTLDADTLAHGLYDATVEIIANEPNIFTVLDEVHVRLRIDSTATAVEDTPLLPQSFALQPNYPNPFNPLTTITYDLPQRSRVVLTVYDVRGKRVRTLLRGTQPAGRRAVKFAGLDDAGRPLASGVYFYRLVAGNFVQTRKMVLLK